MADKRFKDINELSIESIKILVTNYKNDIENGKIKLSEEERKEYEKISRKIDLNKK